MAGSHAGAQHVREVQVKTSLLQRVPRAMAPGAFLARFFKHHARWQGDLKYQVGRYARRRGLEHDTSIKVRPAFALEDKGDVLTRSGGHPGAEVQASGGSRPRSKGARARSSLIVALFDWCDVSPDLCGVFVWCVTCRYMCRHVCGEDRQP
jgi:hypothetical protein